MVISGIATGVECFPIPCGHAILGNRLCTSCAVVMIIEVDASGRSTTPYLLYPLRTSNEQVTMPCGSWNQNLLAAS